ncbi:MULTISPECIES: EAL domain-containing protein [Rahnella]|uniref:EAL domain-containing protein n=1 Tax=Rahnella laticis TaxID=2787622 RepID=A0ABS0DZN6_9GAMM|nr:MULTISPECIES: EAL domain-containing protein [Rahnella]MBF7977884.1 EAL domain-containing protein [Rahnella laticis]MBF7998399.1 EAL domain-containing protein [Rahnella sp. LAC-M12]
MTQDMYESNAATPFFQPIIDYATGKVIAYEVLARWFHKNKWYGPPENFNLRNDLNSEMLNLSILINKVKESIALKPNVFSDIQYLSFNININNADSRIVSLCLELIESGYKGKIVLEINESQEIAENAALSHLLRELNAAGVMLALDDFGHGYLSFSALIKFNVSIIKIDRSLTSNVLSYRANTVVSHIGMMARQLGLSIIAEGVETREIAEALNSMDISFMQGFYFARPAQL